MQKGCIELFNPMKLVCFLFCLFHFKKKTNDESCLRSLTNMQVNVSYPVLGTVFKVSSVRGWSWMVKYG